MKPSSHQEISIFDTSSDLLDKISTYVHKSMVFADEKFTEILHWHGGASMLLNFGAKHVKEFSSFENGDVADHKATLFLSSALIDNTWATLRNIISYSHFQNIVIVTNVHPVMQAVVNFKPQIEEAAMEMLTTMEREIVKWMKEKMDNEGSCTCQIIYIPLVASPILPNMFTLPSHSSFFPLLATDIQLLMTRHKLSNQSELSFEHLPKQLQLKFKLLVSSLNSLSELLNLSEEIFAMGTTSDIIASELASLPWNRNRRKSSNMKASLVLIDRTLDIGNVAHHGFDSTLDRILNVLPRLPGHSTDVCIDMSPVTDVVSNGDFSCVAPGCLSHPGAHKYSSLLNALALLEQKEITSELNRRLVEALEREGLYKKSNQSGVFDTMQHYISLFRNQPIGIKKHSPLLQLSLAVLQALSDRDSALPFGQSVIIEKLILQSFQDDDFHGDDNMIIKVFKEFKKSSGDEARCLEGLLGLLLYIFALDEDRRWSLSSKEETLLEKELVEAFMKDKQAGRSRTSKLVEVCRTDMECLSVVQDLIDKLKGLSTAKSGLQRYRHALEPGTITSPASHQPIIKQVIQDILDPNKPDLLDITHKSLGLGDLIKSGFGFFRGSQKSRPDDHPLVIIFVIGGINMAEVKQVRDVMARNKTQNQILIGGTTTLTANDVLNLALLQDNLCD